MAPLFFYMRPEDYGFTFNYSFGPDEPINNWGMNSDLLEQWKRADKKKIRIAPNQPINTSVFEEAIVLEENGVPTLEGLKEYAPPFTPEGEPKPIITCRIWPI